MRAVPQKLRSDGIVEALLEVRFDSATSIPELVVGQLASAGPWKGYAPVRLPSADIPYAIRKMEKALQGQPILQLDSPDRKFAVKIGEGVLSVHNLVEYQGWENFQPFLAEALSFLYSSVDGFKCTRLGFRYINLLSETKHGVQGVNALNLIFAVGGTKLELPINVNFRRDIDGLHQCMVRISSPEFVTSPHKDFSTLIDIDLYTVGTVSHLSLEEAFYWVEEAHRLLKEEFFALLTDETIANLAEK